MAECYGGSDTQPRRGRCHSVVISTSKLVPVSSLPDGWSVVRTETRTRQCETTPENDDAREARSGPAARPSALTREDYGSAVGPASPRIKANRARPVLVSGASKQNERHYESVLMKHARWTSGRPRANHGGKAFTSTGASGSMNLINYIDDHLAPRILRIIVTYRTASNKSTSILCIQPL